MLVVRPLHRWSWIAATLVIGVAVAIPQSRPSTTAADPFLTAVKPVLDNVCVTCHSGTKAAAGVVLSGSKSREDVVRNPELYTRVVNALRSKAMPPPSAKPISDAQRTATIAAIESILSQECRLADPGRATIRRLNREEYNNTVRDLCGVDFRPADDFPSDDVGNGFDNMGDVLSISPLLMEKYLTAAEQIANRAVNIPRSMKLVYGVNELTADGGANANGEAWTLFAHGFISAVPTVREDGIYRIEILASGDQAGPEKCKLQVWIDGVRGPILTVAATPGDPKAYSYEQQLAKGRHTVRCEFINDFYDPNNPDRSQRDRNLHILSIKIEGPVGVGVTPPNPRLALVPDEFSPTNVRTSIAKFAGRAYRRPPTDLELDRLMSLYQKVTGSGDPPERGLQIVLQAILASPNFLFRVELDPGTTARSLNDYEIASRLSYFLWSTMPDDTLFELARQNRLHQPEMLSQQVTRMVNDPKFAAFSSNFIGQWLQLRKLTVINPDPDLFPTFTETLRSSMIEETSRFVTSLFVQNQPTDRLFTANYTFANAELGKFYGITGAPARGWAQVNTTKDRPGILGHASFLTLTSNPTRTSPVKRGKYILENILGTPVPPPPPNVGVLSEVPSPVTGATVRERIESHRKRPECASCHAQLDPYGFVLEHYDPIGRYRERDPDGPIDASAQLPDKTRMDGVLGLQSALLKKSNLVAANLVTKLLTYAVGRGMTAADKCYVDDVLRHTAANKYPMLDLIKEVVLSDAFLKRGVKK